MFPPAGTERAARELTPPPRTAQKFFSRRNPKTTKPLTMIELEDLEGPLDGSDLDDDGDDETAPSGAAAADAASRATGEAGDGDDESGDDAPQPGAA